MESLKVTGYMHLDYWRNESTYAPTKPDTIPLDQEVAPTGGNSASSSPKYKSMTMELDEYGAPHDDTGPLPPVSMTNVSTNPLTQVGIDQLNAEVAEVQGLISLVYRGRI